MGEPHARIERGPLAKPGLVAAQRIRAAGRRKCPMEAPSTPSRPRNLDQPAAYLTQFTVAQAAKAAIFGDVSAQPL